MKRNLFFALFVIAISSTSFAGSWQPAASVKSAESQVTFTNGSVTKGSLTFVLQGFHLNEISGSADVTISSPGSAAIQKKGFPDLPQFTTSLILPDQGTLSVTVKHAEYQDYTGISLAPSKGNLYRNIDPASVPFVRSEIYSENNFWPASVVDTRDPYILRDFRGQTLLIRPFTYNAVTKILRVYTKLELEYSVNSAEKGLNEIIRSAMPHEVDKDFYYVYRNHFVNTPAVQYIPLSEEGKMLVICEQAWMNAMQPFVEWKKKRGVQVEMVSIQSVGNNTTSISSYIHNYYQVHGLTFVLLVGDATQIATPFLHAGAADPSYGFISGNDSYAEVIIGRFSAESVADVNTQVDRILHYEQINTANDSFLSKGVVIGSNQGPGDDNEMDWEHASNLRTELLAFTYTQVSELYDGTHAGTTDAPGDPGSQDLFNLFQDGIGIMTYTGHGSSNACSTTGLSSGDVQNMTNVNALPFIWSVACVNGEFTNASPCLAESFLRAQYNNQPTGAITTLMSSINQSWSPPMDAQDEMVALLTDMYPGLHRRTFGGISVNGCMHMNDDYGVAGDEMTDTWHCFGDPSLLVRTREALPVTVTVPSTFIFGMNMASVGVSADSAVVCLYSNGNILATGISVNGNCQLTFPPLMNLNPVYVTVTGFNLQTYSTSVPVIPSSGPYVVSQAGTVNDILGNNNHIVETGENIAQDIILNNLGSANATSLQVTITTSDPYVTLNNGTFQYSVLQSNTSVNIPYALNYLLANNVPDQHVIKFDVVVTDANSQSWQSSILQPVNAPDLLVDYLTIDDAAGGNNNHMLEAGETALVTIKCMNNGHSVANQTSGVLTSLSPYVTITNPAFSQVSIGPGLVVSQTFSVSLASNIAISTVFDLTLNINSGAYSGNKTFYQVAGLILETFESNNFNSYNWQTQGNMPWLISTNQPFEGMYCSVSGDVNDNEQSDLLISMVVAADDSVAFWYKVSSEPDYDYLNFYIDGILKNDWSGTVPWTYKSYPVAAGQHTLRWSYNKDSYLSTGDDCSWLDNIRLPVGTAVTAVQQIVHSKDKPVFYPNPAGESVNLLLGKENGWKSVMITDASGRMITEKFGTEFRNGSSIINTSQITNGIYIVNISDEKSQWTVPLIIAH